MVDDPHELAKEHSQQNPTQHHSREWKAHTIKKIGFKIPPQTKTRPFQPRLYQEQKNTLPPRQCGDLKTTPLSLASNLDTASSLASLGGANQQEQGPFIRCLL